MLHTTYVSCGPHGFKEEVAFFLVFFFHYKSVGAYDHRGVASLGHRGLIGRIYVRDH